MKPDTLDAGAILAVLRQAPPDTMLDNLADLADRVADAQLRLLGQPPGHWHWVRPGECADVLAPVPVPTAFSWRAALEALHDASQQARRPLTAREAVRVVARIVEGGG